MTDDDDRRVQDENFSDNAATERLREAVEAGGGIAAVVRRSGVALGTLKGFLRGRDVRRAALVALADACGVSVEWLATGRGPRHAQWITGRTPGADPSLGEDEGEDVAVGPTMPFASEQFMTAPRHIAVADDPKNAHISVKGELTSFVPLMRFHLAARDESETLMNNEQIVEYYAYDERYIRTKLNRRPEDLLLIEARGDSMEPTIRSGDILTVDIAHARALEHAQLYVFNFGANLLVKRVEQRMSGLVLHSENPRYAPEPVPSAEVPTLPVIGQVILVTAPPR